MYNGVTMRCACSAVGQCTDRSPWDRTSSRLLLRFVDLVNHYLNSGCVWFLLVFEWTSSTTFLGLLARIFSRFVRFHIFPLGLGTA